MKVFLSGPCLLLLFLIPSLTHAQAWEQKYGTSVNHRGHYAQTTADGGYIFLASSMNADLGFYDDMKLIRINANGDSLWSVFFNDVDVDYGRSIVQTVDGGFVVLSMSKGGGTGFLHLTKLTGNGIVVWRKIVASPWSTINIALIRGRSLLQTADGGFAIAGELAYVGGGTSEAVLIKTNDKGELTWGRKFMVEWNVSNRANSLEVTPDGGYILSGNSNSSGFVVKCDKNGNNGWTKQFLFGYAADMTLANNNEEGYVFASTVYSPNRGVFLYRLNNSGDTLWTRRIGSLDSMTITSIRRSNDGGYHLSGYRIRNKQNDIILIKTDSEGDTLWTRTYGGPYDDFGYSAEETKDGHFIIAGSTTQVDKKTQAYLIKTDKLGMAITNVITGNIFEDENADCLPGHTERKLANPAYWKVKITPGNRFIFPDTSGKYMIKLDTGAYVVSLVNNHPYWQLNCPSTSNVYNVSLGQFHDTISDKNFGLTPAIDCPLMWVDLATAIVRPCRETVHTIRYCNDGPSDANNAYVELALDPKLSFVSSAFSAVVLDNNVVRFQIGTVKAGECGTFSVITKVDCAASMNSTVCVKAKIFPATICTPSSPGDWDKSSITVSGRCIENGKARFVISNTGTGDMQGSSQYRIYADSAIVKTATFKLNSGDSLVIQMDACDKTMRLEADQRPGHPGKSHPRATVEDCDCGSTPPNSSQMRMAVAQDDADAAVEEECSIVRASFDPNEKLITPVGITTDHYVTPNGELEYRINFQNTGNDTAFKVVLIDTLDANVLDIASVVTGVSSHPCTFKITGNGIVEWTFENINLPDSTTNEKASHGFVKFKINQVAGLSNGTKISNKAAIYFDYNAPVITDPVIVTINDFVPTDGGNYNITIVETKGNPGQLYSSVINILPHPLIKTSTIKIQSPAISPGAVLTFNLFDATGRKLRSVFFTDMQFELERESLMSGIYFIEIRNGSTRIATGKLVAQ